MPKTSAVLVPYWNNFIEEPAKWEQLEDTVDGEVTCGKELPRR